MKAYTFILFIFVGIGFLTNCSNDDNSFQENSINGTWYLTNVSGGLASIDNDFSKGDIKWAFDHTSTILTVENKIGNDNAYYLHSGIYSFNIEDENENQILFVNNDKYRMVILSIDENLIITDYFNDGFTAEFKR